MKISLFGKKQTQTSVCLPKTAQQTIPIRRIYRDGIWEVEGKFSRSWRFTDINYAVADEEDKKDMLLLYCALEKSLPTDAITKISVVNKRLNQLEFQREVLMPASQDGRDTYRAEYNRMMLSKAAEGNNIVQERYITVSVERRSIEEARSFFTRVGSDLSVGLKKLSSRLYDLDNTERLRVLHDFSALARKNSSVLTLTGWHGADSPFKTPSVRTASSFTPTILNCRTTRLDVSCS